nr:uncharacterized protein LOC113400004 [Vanessa tameamea]
MSEGHILLLQDNVKNLGLLLDTSFSWVFQVAEMSRKMYAIIDFLRRWKNLLPIKAKVSLVNAFLFPILDYADACYIDLTEDLLNKLERLQNLAIRFIFGLRKFDHVSQYRSQLKWLPIRLRRNLHVLSLLYSILYVERTPPYLKELFKFLGSDSIHNLRSSEDNKLHTNTLQPDTNLQQLFHYENRQTLECTTH